MNAHQMIQMASIISQQSLKSFNGLGKLISHFLDLKTNQEGLILHNRQQFFNSLLLLTKKLLKAFTFWLSFCSLTSRKLFFVHCNKNFFLAFLTDSFWVKGKGIRLGETYFLKGKKVGVPITSFNRELCRRRKLRILNLDGSRYLGASACITHVYMFFVIYY